MSPYIPVWVWVVGFLILFPIALVMWAYILHFEKKSDARLERKIAAAAAATSVPLATSQHPAPNPPLPVYDQQVSPPALKTLTEPVSINNFLVDGNLTHVRVERISNWVNDLPPIPESQLRTPPPPFNSSTNGNLALETTAPPSPAEDTRQSLDAANPRAAA